MEPKVRIWHARGQSLKLMEKDVGQHPQLLVERSPVLLIGPPPLCELLGRQVLGSPLALAVDGSARLGALPD
jgi:hypothetical protein